MKRGKVEKHVSRGMNNRVRDEHSWGTIVKWDNDKED
jgi:hypothetical protein